MISWSQSGGDAMQRRLRQLGTQLSHNAGLALYRQGEAIMTRSKAEFVPVKTGALKASGRVNPPQSTGRGWTVDLVYGGPAVNYALVQHETPWYRHRVGQWKYLEQPMYEATATLLQQVAAEMVTLL